MKFYYRVIPARREAGRNPTARHPTSRVSHRLPYPGTGDITGFNTADGSVLSGEGDNDVFT